MWNVIADLRTAVIAGVAAVLFLLWLAHRQPRNIPPGPRGWPLLGYLPKLILSDDVPVTLTKEAQRYGEVMSVNLAGQLVVVLTSPRAVKEAFYNPDVSSRPYNNLYHTLVPNGKGVATCSGQDWSVQRKFCQSMFNSFGIGKSSFEDSITTEAASLVKEMRSYKERPFNPTALFCNAVSNITCSVTFGKRFEYSDPRFQKLLASLIRVFEVMGSGGAVQFLPIAQKLTFLPSYKELLSRVGSIMKFIRGEVEAHRRDFDPDNCLDFIDTYLNKIRSQSGADATSPLNPDNLLVTIFELFMAGSDTTSCSLRWALLFMMAHPEVQAGVQQELDDVVGRNRLPRLSDLPNLPYTESTILEILRVRVIAPLPMPHRASKQTQILGYHIPKDTLVIENLWALCRKESVWKDADTFDPSRFLKDGKVSSLREKLSVFGIGRRACFGEKLARMELFIFFSFLLHQFTFKKPEGAPPITLKSTNGFVVAPLPYQTCAVSRD
ncbi:cytochrome P450 2J6-like [Patiria miniata]|uniref:Steroid 21-hydroxylase n=1 Tax=Patiria miniata TaxID=46514 RepID=A0A913Z7L7_PATMI|nr:cytochrome P450 2J6-like [Patiria miniata]